MDSLFWGASVALIDEILNYLRTDYKPAPGEFLPFDQKKLMEKIRLREIARERGLKGQPPADATELDVVEHDIVEAMRRQALDDERRTREQLGHYTQRLQSASPRGESAEMFATAQEALTQFRAAMMTAKETLGRARKNVVERDHQVEIFKAKNGLDRPPDPPKGHWVMSLILVVCFLAEVGINSSVLSVGSEFGVLGGVIAAFFYTFISMACAFMLGFWGLTFLNHIRWSWKLFGVFVSTGFLVAILLVNLLAAHYRVAMTSGLTEVDAALRAAQTIREDFLLFVDDTQSILMVGLSLVVSIITMLDGLFWRDAYPGYGKVGKLAVQAHARWMGELNHHRDELEGIYDRYAKRIRSLQTSLSDRQHMIPKIRDNRRMLVANFNTHLKHIEDVGRYLLKAYREANAETRGQAPKPKYWKEVWCLDGVQPINPPEDVAFDPKEWDAVAESLRDASRQLKEAHDEIIEWIMILSRSKNAEEADERLALERKRRNAPAAESVDETLE